jgi:molybdopterin molybdotransferase
LKGHYQNGEVQPLFAQESFRLRSFAMANCLIQLNEDMKTNKKGDLVEIHVLPVYG